MLTDEKALHARIFQFPTSAIKQNDRKINYYDFLMQAEYLDCCDAVKRIVPRIDLEQIDSFICDVPYISDLQKEFYTRYIRERFALILQPALDRVTTEGLNPSGSEMGL